MEKRRRVIRKPELLSKISLSEATIWRRERCGDFPGRVHLGGNSVGWFEDEIEAWLTAKGAARNSASSVRRPPGRQEAAHKTDPPVGVRE